MNTPVHIPTGINIFLIIYGIILFLMLIFILTPIPVLLKIHHRIFRNRILKETAAELKEIMELEEEIKKEKSNEK